MIELQRMPTHPGEILKEEFLVPYEMTQSHLSKALGTSFRAINELVNEKRGITVEMSLKLSKYFGTTPQLWLNLQNQYDLYKVAKKKKDVLDEVKAYEVIVA
ncbi:MAG: Addiction module antidote protein, HigA family [uncultured Sulfurovum sp.]|uniref:Addiction module antidote protein, HigA family n=1 Tax=uncultured Sulfurovum sp. TaxID=269237 RepID=A0A6S6TFD1_9BACT|nr:MAG: Addiction module antidote protein, HigA family [uncultured Sulfurovum sp.]